MSIYTPNNIQEAKELSQLFSTCGRLSAQEILLLHAVYGHHYGGNMGLTMTQAYCLKGKPTLNADAMAGIVRKSGLCKYIKIVEWTTELCTLAMARNDEDIEHQYTYTKEMAELQGLYRNNNWKTMPKQMLRARCLTMGLRATFPEAVSGIYSADEIADNMDMNDEERLEIVAESLGEEVKKPPTVPPQKKKSDPVKPYHQRINPARDLTTINRVIEELKKENCDIDQSIKAMEYYTTKPLTMCNELELNKLFYSIGLSPIRIFLQEGKKDLSRRGFNEWNAADLETLSSLYESFYGCTMNLEKDKSLQDYISRITNLSDGPLWSEVMIRCRKLHNSGKMTQSQVAYYEDLVSHNPYDLSYYFKFDRDLTTIENT
jgi:hypothetical protein